MLLTGREQDLILYDPHHKATGARYMFLIFYLASEAGSSLEGKFGEKNKHETSDTCLILLSDETMFNRMIFIHYSLELDHILGYVWVSLCW